MDMKCVLLQDFDYVTRENLYFWIVDGVEHPISESEYFMFMNTLGFNRFIIKEVTNDS